MKHFLSTTLAAVFVFGSAVPFHSASAADKTTGQAGIGPSFKGPIGLQLYSLRAEFTRNVPATLDKVRDYGIKYVELAGTYNLSNEKFKEMLAERGLVPISGHFSFDRYEKDVAGIVKDAQAFGLKQIGCAWIPHAGSFDEKECRHAAEVFNKAGAELAKHGITFIYHTHGYEFEPHGQATLFDLLVSETKPEAVSFQMDVFWIVHPGQDPAKLLHKYKGRWASMHVKDMKKGVQGDLSGKSDVKNDVTVGTGQMDWPVILKAARDAGVKYYFIEDESPTAAEQIPLSLKFLEQVKF